VTVETYKHTWKLTSPVIRVLVRYSTSRTFDKLIYQFEKANGEFDYQPLIDFLDFISHRQSDHTPDAELLPSLKNIATNIDNYMNPNINSVSPDLVRMSIRMSKRHQTFAEFTPIPPSEQPLANANGRFFFSEYVTNDVTLPRDDHMMMGFEQHTGIAYRPNSCLASCCLYICYAGDGGRPAWCRKDRWTERRAAGEAKSTALEPPTYESLAKLCGGVFLEDGSLQLTLEQIGPFLDRYRTHCYVVNANGAMTHCRLYTGKRCKDIVVLRLVQHHKHVRMVYYNDQSIIQKFDDAFLKLPHVSLGQKGPGSLLCWDFDEPVEDSNQREKHKIR
jgi:hypothetical protein